MIYDPNECDEHGVPLDWERCRLCKGSGAGRQRVEEVVPGRLRSVRVPNGDPGSDEVCGRCDGHGSLKAAALYGYLRYFDGYDIRCEGCGHPMSEGTWNIEPIDVRTLGWPHDLRPEKLAVLCLRCYAERKHA